MSEPTFADHFSGHASAYAAYRPRYPATLFEWLTSVVPGTEQAWDVGTGSGQVAHGLVTRFARVVATDPSAAQVAQAAPHPRIRYAVSAYESGLPDASAQLVAVGQALHWFDLDAFFAEARRVLQPRGVVAAFAYAHSRVTPEVDRWVREYHDVTLRDLWAPEHHLIHQGYRSLQLPLDEIAAPAFELCEQWTLAQYGGFLRTWSSVQRLIAREGEERVVAFETGLAERWGEARVRPVLWPLVLRVGTLR
ncbi:MAG: class I SAM-dependent methyltransferase [Gemmatimonadaceae bacterium]